MKHFKTFIKKTFSILCAFVLLSAFIPNVDYTEAFAASYKYYTVGPAAGSSVINYYNASASSFSYSNVGSSIISSVTCSSKGQFYFSTKTNYGSKRIGYIYVYNGSKEKIDTIQVTQQAISLSVKRVTPDADFAAYNGSKMLSGYGQTVKYSITSNMAVKVYIQGDGVSSKQVASFGTNQSKANATTTKTISVKYPSNTTGKLRKYMGIVVCASSKTSVSGEFIQPSTTNAFNAADTASPLGSIDYNGYRYHIIPATEVLEAYTLLETLHVDDTDFDLSVLAGAEFEGEDDTSFENLMVVNYIQLLKSFLNSFSRASIYINFYSSSSNVRYVTIEAYDSMTARLFQEFAGKYLDSVELEDGRSMRMYFDVRHIRGNQEYSEYSIWLDENGDFYQSLNGYDNDAWYIEGVTQPWFEFGYFPNTSVRPVISQNQCKTPFEPMEVLNFYQDLLDVIL